MPTPPTPYIHLLVCITPCEAVSQHQPALCSQANYLVLLRLGPEEACDERFPLFPTWSPHFKLATFRNPSPRKSQSPFYFVLLILTPRLPDSHCLLPFSLPYRDKPHLFSTFLTCRRRRAEEFPESHRFSAPLFGGTALRKWLERVLRSVLNLCMPILLLGRAV